MGFEPGSLWSCGLEHGSGEAVRAVYWIMGLSLRLPNELGRFHLWVTNLGSKILKWAIFIPLSDTRAGGWRRLD